MTLSLGPLSWLATLLTGGALSAGLGVAGVLLVRQTGSLAANRAMGGLLVVASALVLYVLLLYVQPPGENLGIVFAPLSFTFALGPLLYAYVRARLGLGRPGAVHWVLPVAQAVWVVGVALSPLDVQQAYMGRVFAPWWATTQTVLFVLSLGLYLALSWRAIPAGRSGFAWARARDRWLRRVVAVAALALVAVAVFQIVGPLFPERPGQRFWGLGWVSFLETVLYSAVLYVLALGGWVQADLHASDLRPDDLRRPVSGPSSSPHLGAEAGGAERQEHYNLDPDAARAHAAALDRLVAEERPHLDPNLSLGTLAGMVGVTEKVLSYVLNDTLGTSYTEFVNGLRVDEAKRRLASPETAHLTVLAVGLDSGFASKSTFNRVFKERTGETPSAFRQRAPLDS